MAQANPPNGLVLTFVSNDCVERFPQYTNFLLRQWDKKSQFLNVCAEEEILLEKLICGVKEHRLEAYATLTPLRGRDGYVVHLAQSL